MTPLTRQNLPPVSELTADKIADFSASDKVVVIGFFEDTTSSDYKAFESVANKLRDDFLFGATTDSTAAEQHEVKVPAIVLFKQFDEGKNTFGEKLTEDGIADFVKTNSVPLMDDIGPENYGKYVSSGLPIAYLFIAKPEERKTAGAEIESLAKEYKGKIHFVYIDAGKYGGHGKNLNLKEKWPAFVIQEPEHNLKFPFDQEKQITKKDVQKFLDDYVNKKLKPSTKSEKEPEKNDGPVKVIVGTNYEKIALDKTKDVLVEFYART